MKTERPKRSVPPTREEILAFLRDQPRQAGFRSIARAFSLDTGARQVLRETLRALKAEGAFGRRRERPQRPRKGGPKHVQPKGLTMIEVTGVDADGEVIARAVDAPADRRMPVMYVAPAEHGHPALGPGDRALASLRHNPDGTTTATVVRRVAEAPDLTLGIFATVGGEGRIRPVDKRGRAEIRVARANWNDAKPGDLVQAEVLSGQRLGLREARVVERLGSVDEPRALSLIAIHDHGLPYRFSQAALDEAAATGPAPLEERDDMRPVPLVTIDGEDARDFDDAVWAEAEPDGGFHLIVAIADVSWYVRPGSALDRAAYERGNSAYFPDRVVPMLPEALSNGWCSLKPNEDRPCLVAHLWIDSAGTLRRHRFVRALMRSRARLTYEQIQAAVDGAPDETCAPLLDTVIRPLFAAYRALDAARRERGVLELEVPERKVILAEDGSVERIGVRARLDSHKLVEEFMIAANVASAEALEAKRQPAMYRIHSEPTIEKLEAFREFIETFSMSLPRGQAVRPAQFNRLLAKIAGTKDEAMFNQVVLRTQAQAAYAPANIGHFGLALRRYCHFTSPIRRYADLVVHRALIRGMGLGSGGLDGTPDMEAIGEHISATERRAMAAERDTVDRFCAAYLADRVGSRFPGTINGVTRFGLFVTLTDIGADGLVPISSLPGDYYVHDAARHRLVGQRHRRVYAMGEPVEVVLVEADAPSGGMIFRLVDHPVAGRRPGGGRRPRR